MSHGDWLRWPDPATGPWKSRLEYGERDGVLKPVGIEVELVDPETPVQMDSTTWRSMRFGELIARDRVARMRLMGRVPDLADTRFADLEPEQALAMYVAMHVRNRMEDFHVEHLTDAQMAQLNPIIRQAIYEALVMNDSEALFTLTLIPDHWEVPTREGG